MDLINRQSAITALERTKEKDPKGDIASFYNKIVDNKIAVIEAQPPIDELTIVTEYCRKRNLVLITMESFRVLQTYYNSQNGMGGEQNVEIH